MLKKFLGTVALGLAVSGLVACSSSKPEQKQLDTNSISAASIMANKSLTTTDKAEQLAKAAEQLITVQGFVYANDVADLALQQDANNLRAKFVKAVLAPIMAQKGILARIAPLAEKDYELKNEYDKMLADLDTKSPNSTLKTFLLDGQPDITSEAGVQGYLDGIANGFGELRQFAKNSKNETLTVMASDAFFDAMKKRFEDACIVVETSPWEYEYQCPSPVNMLEVSFSRADFEGLQQIASGYELYFSLNNSYDLSGAIQVALDHKGEQTKPNAQKIIDELLKDKAFATLRAGNGFKKIKDMGLDAVTGVRWVIKNQNSLCPFGSSNPRNRLGFLFNSGMCVQNTSEVAAGLKKADDILSGKAIWTTFNGVYGQQYNTLLKPSALMDSPIADLRVLTPLKFNKCDQLEGVADQTIGGLLPKSDADTILQLGNYCW